MHSKITRSERRGGEKVLFVGNDLPHISMSVSKSELVTCLCGEYLPLYLV